MICSLFSSPLFVDYFLDDIIYTPVTFFLLLLLFFFGSWKIIRIKKDLDNYWAGIRFAFIDLYQRHVKSNFTYFHFFRFFFLNGKKHTGRCYDSLVLMIGLFWYPVIKNFDKFFVLPFYLGNLNLFPNWNMYFFQIFHCLFLYNARISLTRLDFLQIKVIYHPLHRIVSNLIRFNV
jgi:hypothetical protein